MIMPISNDRGQKKIDEGMCVGGHLSARMNKNELVKTVV